MLGRVALTVAVSAAQVPVQMKCRLLWSGRESHVPTAAPLWHRSPREAVTEPTTDRNAGSAAKELNFTCSWAEVFTGLPRPQRPHPYADAVFHCHSIRLCCGTDSC